MKHLCFTGYKLGKDGRKMFELLLPWGKKTLTKDPIRTLNKIGHLFYFTAQHLKERGVINNLEMVELLGWRKKYGKLKKACILELK